MRRNGWGYGAHPIRLKICSLSLPQTYTYHDEHSAPFSWRTRSQQDLPFESGRPEQALVAEAMAEGLEVLETSPSQVLTRYE